MWKPPSEELAWFLWEMKSYNLEGTGKRVYCKKFVISIEIHSSFLVVVQTPRAEMLRIPDLSRALVHSS